MTTGEIISICALCVSVIVALFAVLTFVRNGNRNVATDVKEVSANAERRGYEQGALSVKLDTIREGVDAIKSDVRALRGDVGDIEAKVIKLDQRVTTLEREMHEVRKIQGSVSD